MQDNLRLGEEVRSTKKQMERERQQLQAEIQRLELNTDELQAQLERTAEEHRAVVEDYHQKIDALNKQLKSDKQFIEVCRNFINLDKFRIVVWWVIKLDGVILKMKVLCLIHSCTVS